MASGGGVVVRERRRENALQRTYRYLRIAVVASVVLLCVAVLVAMGQIGVLPSISAYYYSPARDGFVGALIAVSLALLALSGRGLGRALLDAAALFAPIIAFVPTQIQDDWFSHVDLECAGAAACIPNAVLPAVDNGVMSYLIVGALLLLLALGLGIGSNRSGAPSALRTIWPSLVVATAVLLTVWLLWWLASDVFLRWAHYAATIAFFVIIAIVAALEAFGVRSDAPWRPSRRFRIAYIAIAIAIGADLVFIAMLDGLRLSVPPVLVCEFIALGLFGAFWILQTIEKWDVRDPAYRSHATDIVAD
jgi:hypothetical protein